MTRRKAVCHPVKLEEGVDLVSDPVTCLEDRDVVFLLVVKLDLGYVKQVGDLGS